MKIKKEYIILIALIAIVSFYLFQKKTDKTNYQLPKIAKVQEIDITKLEIKGPEGTIVLNKKDGAWIIGSQQYLADSKKVKKILETISGFTLTALVSESKNYERYDLHDKKKISLKAWAGDELKSEFDVGKGASTYRHTFVKISQDDRVFHAQDNFRSRLDYTLDDLRDKKILAFSKDSISEIRFVEGKNTKLYTKKKIQKESKNSDKKNDDKASDDKATEDQSAKTLWKTQGDEKVDQGKINGLLNTLSSLECDKFIEDKKKENFKNPQFVISLKGDKQYSLSIFAKSKDEEDKYPAISSQSDYPFMLSKWEADDILEKLKAKKDKDSD